MYSAEEAYSMLCASDEESSLEDSDADYEPLESSDTLTSSSDCGSDDDVPAIKIQRRYLRSTNSSEQCTGSTSTDLPGTSTSHTNQCETIIMSADTQMTELAPVMASESLHRQQDLTPVTPIEGCPFEISNPVWSHSDIYRPTIPPFTAQAGVNVPTQNFAPIDFFKLVITEQLLQEIVLQTNLYAQQFLASNPSSFYAKPHYWKPTTVPEIKQFLALTFNMGLTKKSELRSYWSSNPIYHMPIFSAVMARARYEILMRFLHFNDNTLCPRREDRLHKIRPLINHFNKIFPELYTPQKNIAVDESLIHFTGRLAFKQYIPSKRARYGVKLYKLCESGSGYTYAFRVYEGKDTQLSPSGCPTYMGINGKIVWDLISPLFRKGYNLYLDNYYTSVPLFKHLYMEGTICCGTVRSNRKGFPKSLVNTRLNQGESSCLRSSELLAVKYRDRRNVFMLSTLHTDTTVPVAVTRRNMRAEKPACVVDYNKYMGAVDFNDQMLKPYLVMRRSKYWYKKKQSSGCMDDIFLTSSLQHKMISIPKKSAGFAPNVALGKTPDTTVQNAHQSLDSV
ncbi:piggyBac transposable element-derived protein 4-like [Bufo bufo]|uniref:piggyBac transposable element-derived protein 4-like n=1 Tax=Bufo bufo TaxID=8384 RepID=UPI001ABDE614|nr:piggyBac transposable element-derived protein 4-like [Bufo bufo]